MNEIEKMFYDALLKAMQDLDEERDVEPSAVIDLYRVDFLIDKKFIIEIDGHEYHKTKEQRLYDYKRERYLYRHGYYPIRFMGTEVFLDAYACADDALYIMTRIGLENSSWWGAGYDACKNRMTENAKQVVE